MSAVLSRGRGWILRASACSTFRSKTGPQSRTSKNALRIYFSTDSSATKAFPEDTMWLPMPKLSPSMRQGTISSWELKQGATFSEYDIGLTITTSELYAEGDLTEETKGPQTLLIELLEEGYVAKILKNVGDSVQVGHPIAILCEDLDSVPLIRDLNISVEGMQLYESGEKIAHWQGYLKGKDGS